MNSEKFQEIIDSYINGNFSQLKEQFNELSYVEKFEFISELKNNDIYVSNKDEIISILAVLLINEIKRD